MAQRLTVELDEHEMRKIEAAARAHQLDPQSMTAKQLVLALGAGNSVAEAQSHNASTEAKRAKRLAAIMSMHGIWKDDPSKPKDPVAYQREVRAEWQ
ncbi:hypothetical protein GTP46_12215 [Duganella sp. FT135W]|uniref:Uncharacterized protein n=1 Tax=Duganella flavida TaxID=2692175 RepID=A0A6L8KG40_9BURK|nr:hypothetical protein [Duganella flavida]MYM23411.1 hypothetical protein [Duganella flavida]